MSKNKTVKNHFVPNRYLKEFKYNGKLKVRDKDKEKTFYVNETRNVGFQNNLYTLKEKLTLKDIEALMVMFPYEDNEVYHNILELFMIYINDDIYRIFKTIDGSGAYKKLNIPFNSVNRSVVDNIIDSLDSKDESRVQENLYTYYENLYWNILEKIKSKDISFYYDNLDESYFVYRMKSLMCIIYNEFDDRLAKRWSREKFLDENILSKIPKYDLWTFVITQFFRIPNAQNNKDELNKLNQILGSRLNDDKILLFYRHIMPIFFTEGLIRDGYDIIFINNSTSKPFITSDRPVVNLKWEGEDSIEKNEIELFYPISQFKGILITNRMFLKGVMYECSEEEVDFYNKKMRDFSKRFIYG